MRYLFAFLFLCPLALSCQPSARQEADKLFAEMRYSDAAVRYAPLVEAPGASLDVKRNYALSLAWSGQADEAKPLLEALRKQSPDADVEAAYIDAVALTNGADVAAKLLDPALKKFPQSATLHRAAGTVLAQQGNIDAALEHLDRALTIDPTLAAAEANIGDIALLGGDIRSALDHYRKAVSLEPSSPMSVRIRVRIAQLLMNSNPEQALVWLEEAQAVEPGAPDVVAELGKVSGTLGMYDQCVQFLRKAHDVLPKRTDLVSTLGYCFLQRARTAPDPAQSRQDLLAAKMWFERTLKQDPVYKGANNNLGQALAMLGDTEAAEARFNKELSLYPGSIEALTNLGRLMADRGQSDQAIALLERAFNVDRTEVVLAGEIGRLAFQSGDDASAYKWYQTAFTLCHETLPDHPCHAEVPYQLARLAVRSGDKEAAVTYFLQAVNAGFRDFGRARAEPDLRGVLGDPRVARAVDAAVR